MAIVSEKLENESIPSLEKAGVPSRLKSRMIEPICLMGYRGKCQGDDAEKIKLIPGDDNIEREKTDEYIYLGVFARRPSVARDVFLFWLGQGEERTQNMAARAATAKPLRSTPAIQAIPRDFVSILLSWCGTDARVAGADDGKEIPDDGVIVAVLRDWTGACEGGTDPGLGCARSLEGQRTSNGGC
ncbi:hypothetical protein AZE42_11475 [Rhizopogon vesiculosus]|uniref:Uncharacterized protein n=1 Tax=Rhizopogon vesiculosus TaxID=180088 RepID=A0A1J8R529_9AGAM|nr:hypothetical protein AZE42_11475 [Rhizopogon vesiculosus]